MNYGGASISAQEFYSRGNGMAFEGVWHEHGVGYTGVYDHNMDVDLARTHVAGGNGRNVRETPPPQHALLFFTGCDNEQAPILTSRIPHVKDPRTPLPRLAGIVAGSGVKKDGEILVQPNGMFTLPLNTDESVISGDELIADRRNPAVDKTRDPSIPEVRPINDNDFTGYATGIAANARRAAEGDVREVQTAFERAIVAAYRLVRMLEGAQARGKQPKQASESMANYLADVPAPADPSPDIVRNAAIALGRAEVSMDKAPGPSSLTDLVAFPDLLVALNHAANYERHNIVGIALTGNTYGGVMANEAVDVLLRQTTTLN